MIKLLHGDCRDLLKALPDELVHCVVTSPPYWGLRDYGTAKWDGGDAGAITRRKSAVKGLPHRYRPNKPAIPEAVQ